MKKTLSRKLDLRRETIAPLKTDDLDGVNGGQAMTTRTITACPTHISWCQSVSVTLPICSVPPPGGAGGK